MTVDPDLVAYVQRVLDDLTVELREELARLGVPDPDEYEVSMDSAPLLDHLDHENV